MPNSPERITLSLEADATWIAAFGLPETDAQLATLQGYLDVDDLEARAAFYRTLLGGVPEDKRLDPMHRRLPSVVANIRALSRLNVDVKRVLHEHPAALSYSAASRETKAGLLGLLGIDVARVVNRQPSVLGYEPEKIVDRLRTFAELGLDGVAIVNKLPVTIGLAREKVMLTALLFQQTGIWDEVRSAWNDGHRLNLFIAPVESLALMAGLDPDAFRASPSTAPRFVTRSGWNKQHREELLKRISPDSPNRDPQCIANLGAFVPAYLDVQHRARRNDQRSTVAR